MKEDSEGGREVVEAVRVREEEGGAGGGGGGAKLGGPPTEVAVESAGEGIGEPDEPYSSSSVIGE
jgi:hypothetical protein